MRMITEQNEVSEVVIDIMMSPLLGFDIEATGLSPHNDKLLLLQLASPDTTWVFDATRVNLHELFDVLRFYEETVVVQNGIFDLQFLYDDFGFWWQSPKFFDPYLMHRLKNIGVPKKFEEKYLGLDALAKAYLDVDLSKEVRDSFQYVEPGDEFSEEQLRYAALDAEILIPLYREMLPKVEARQSKAIIALENDSLPVTAQMEYVGMRVDTDLWMSLALEKEAAQAEAGARANAALMEVGAPEPINLNSHKQIKEAVLKHRRIQLKDTALDTIRSAAHRWPDFFEPLIEYKEYRQGCTTFGRKWLRHVGEDGIARGEFHQLGTDTGRYSSSKPNFQNIPVRGDGRYRDAFIAREGYSLITTDLSQIEYRLAAEFSGEQIIIQEYLKESPDFHQLTADAASKVLGIEVPRFYGKTMNFALIYQAAPSRLIPLLHCSMAEAKQLHHAYWASYPTLRNYMISQGQQARLRGYAETKLGRRRYALIPKGTNPWYISEIERQLGNMPIQGSAADIVKYAALFMFPKVQELGGNILNQVHDELIVEVPQGSEEVGVDIVESAFVRAGEMVLEVIPTVANSKVGDRWMK